MTPHEVEVLRNTGYFLSFNLPGFIAEWILFGISLSAVLYTLSLFKFVEMKLRSSMPIVLAMGVCGIMASLFFISCTGVVAIYLDIPLLPSRNATALQRITGPAGRRSFFVINVLQNWVASSVPILSDVIVIWRAWCLYPTQVWAMVLPVLLILGTSATTLASNIPLASYETWYRYVSGDYGDLAILGQVSSWLSLSTNAVTTALVGYKLWIYKKQVLPDLTVKRRTNTVGRTLASMVESGVVFCVIQLAMTATQIAYLRVPLVTDSLYIGTLVVTNLQIALAAVYPVLVITVVRSGNSIRDYYDSFSLPTLVSEADHT